MARIKISLPSEFVFSTDIPVRIGDINRGLHLGHESFFFILWEARTRFLCSFGYTETDISGAGLIITNAAIVYLKQGHYGQTLKVDIAVNDFTTRGFDMVYRISDAETGIEIARAKTGHLFYNYQQQKVTTIPHDFKKKFSK